jgi:prepilin-type N-terminal cleavage/methylation domain-containing protein
MMPAVRDKAQAFTLIELLIVMVLIVILAGMLLPGFGPKMNALKKVAESEEANLVMAINSYYADYGQLPASSNAVAAADTNDFTFERYLIRRQGRDISRHLPLIHPEKTHIRIIIPKLLRSCATTTFGRR